MAEWPTPLPTPTEGGGNKATDHCNSVPEDESPPLPPCAGRRNVSASGSPGLARSSIEGLVRTQLRFGGGLAVLVLQPEETAGLPSVPLLPAGG